jgi:hypothetical protein
MNIIASENELPLQPDDSTKQRYEAIQLATKAARKTVSERVMLKTENCATWRATRGRSMSVIALAKIGEHELDACYGKLPSIAIEYLREEIHKEGLVVPFGARRQWTNENGCREACSRPSAPGRLGSYSDSLSSDRMNELQKRLKGAARWLESK